MHHALQFLDILLDTLLVCYFGLINLGYHSTKSKQVFFSRLLVLKLFTLTVNEFFSTVNWLAIIMFTKARHHQHESDVHICPHEPTVNSTDVINFKMPTSPLDQIPALTHEDSRLQ